MPWEEELNDVPKFQASLILSSHREMLSVRLEVIHGVSSPHTPLPHLEVRGNHCRLLTA